MQRFKRLFRLLLPVLLLFAALALYAGYVRPKAVENRGLFAGLETQRAAYQTLFEEKGLYPTPELLNALVRAEKDASAALNRLMPPVPSDRKLETQLKYIFNEWGYRPSDGIYQQVSRFQTAVAHTMGPEAAACAVLFIKVFSFSLLRAGIPGFEKLECLPGKNEAFSGVDSLQAFEVNLVFTSGITEGLQFVEEWILGSGGGVLLSLESIAFRRVDAGGWIENIRHFSGPPVRISMKVKAIFMKGKGWS